MRYLGIVILFLTFPFESLAIQPLHADSSAIRKNKLIYYSTLTSVYSVTMTGLWSLWYSEHNTTRFHWFNDGGEWLGMDKAGHAFGAFHFQDLSHHGLCLSGYSEKRAVFESAISAWLAFASLEVFDGFSDGWGASAYDLMANTTGIALFSVQQLLWKEQRLVPKFSCKPGKYAQYRPDLLGNSLLERCIKDYNGQTYWISYHVKSTISAPWWPNWLNVAVGYGATGMLGGKSNPTEWNGKTLPRFSRKHQFYFSPDIDLRKIKTKNKWLRTFLYGINMVKFPLPGVEYSDHKITPHWIVW